MPTILALQSGNKSIKYDQFAISEKNSELAPASQGFIEVSDDYEEAIKRLLRTVGDLSDIRAVAHKLAYGGDLFKKPVLINSQVLRELEETETFLNSYGLAGVKAISSFLPDLKQVAVFDTAFYSGLPEFAKLYALPVEISEKYKLYRYGSNGIAHEQALIKTAESLGKDPKKINIISCFLDEDWSVTAIRKGMAIDTSMGNTVMEGLPMMNRCGDIDPGIIFKLFRYYKEEFEQELSSEQDQTAKIIEMVRDLLSNRSGIKGVARINEYQELIKGVSLGSLKKTLAFDIACYRLVKYIGGYWAALDGQVDAIALSGAMGSGNNLIKNYLIKKFKYLKDTEILSIEPDDGSLMAKKAWEIIKDKRP